MDMISIPFAKFVFLFRIPSRNKGKLTSEPKLISPPNFFSSYIKAIESSKFTFEKNEMIKIIILRLANSPAINPFVNSFIFKIPGI